jgi:hypothetical protein
VTAWTTNELGRLRELAPYGATAVAAALDRSVLSVKMAAHRHRISLRRAGSRGGLMLGQPRSVHTVGPARSRALEQLRAEALEGKVDIAKLERRARLLGTGAPLCPHCAVRPIEVETTGLCEQCHVELLADAHAMEADRRRLDRERQRKHRAGDVDDEAVPA